MANIILPQVSILNEINDSTNLMVEQNGEINRYPISDLDIGGGDVTINLDSNTGVGTAANINATTLGGYAANDYVRHDDNKFLFLKPKAGFIYPLAADTIPEGFLLCNGAEYSRTEYPELFTAIGTIYGVGDGSTTFNVPNLATRVPVGKGSGYALGDTGGEEKHTLTISEMPSHQHNLGMQIYNNTAGSANVSGNSSAASISALTGSTGGSNAHNNMQPYTVVNYIIATGKNTGVSVQDIITGAQALPLGIEYGGTGATDAATALEKLGGTSIELLWENASPSSAMSAQTITMDCSNFAFFIVGAAVYNGIPDSPRWFIVRKNYTTQLNCGYAYIYRARNVKITDTHIEIFDGLIGNYNSGTGESTDNTSGIITSIYGIKGVFA